MPVRGGWRWERRSVENCVFKKQWNAGRHKRPGQEKTDNLIYRTVWKDNKIGRNAQERESQNKRGGYLSYNEGEGRSHESDLKVRDGRKILGGIYPQHKVPGCPWCEEITSNCLHFLVIFTFGIIRAAHNKCAFMWLLKATCGFHPKLWKGGGFILSLIL